MWIVFPTGDLVEAHHRDHDRENNHSKNLAAMHRHCHDGVHRGKEVITDGSIHDKDDSAEEPYECESLTYGFEDQPGGDPPAESAPFSASGRVLGSHRALRKRQGGHSEAVALW